ncbi:thioredoxin [Candidatus Methylacidiphilum fumarolicum]|jgi:thioredoxin 1|uniref:Thioredoxin n=2 Tax=Candidatus Methylacidiphilum fumarolicum TaxID=591154 RepID=I0JWA0_METFB|nr:MULTISPECIES: thioredoxin [Methylacidiphilum (ex Ratnadevi et al. 2023)]MBW6415829.1 thioredoxin [Candidatus Methylacidiphilum fumarolicum]TFE66322.1 thioredoxin [Methylacidiphilum sp. Yel]TFE67608.1 thioredoxin [Candidatus Methylacidiphilum fumarolicum]TFE72299.1 thioredoxin [Candidatus Methylacidiphilum fumarolicum]TFE75469.1 thioredoxin [Candidatus Methylacidiphilum fumarolicum]
MASQLIKSITSKEFENEVIKSPQVVVVDFWAEWCGPCHMLSPVLDELAKELDGKTKFVKVNVDQEPNLAYQYSIQSIPTLLIFKGGQIKGKQIGVTSKNQILNKIKDAEMS